MRSPHLLQLEKSPRSIKDPEQSKTIKFKKNLPDNVEDMGSISGPGSFHVLQDN